MSVDKTKGGITYRYNFVLKGRRFSRSTGKTTKREALKVEAEAKKEALALMSSGATQKVEMTLDQAASLYWHEVAKFTATAGTCQTQMIMLLDIIGEHTLINNIDNAIVARFVSKRRGMKDKRYKDQKTAPLISPASVNREIELLRRILLRVADIHKAPIQFVRFSKHKLAEPDAPDRVLTIDEEEALLAQLVPHAVAPVAFLLLIGQRKTNCLTVDWSQIDLQGRTINFKVKSKKFAEGRNIRVPINEDLLLLLVRMGPKKSGPVFTFDPDICPCSYCKRNPGKPIIDIRTTFKAACRRAGISEDFRIHDIRHTTGSRILALTGDLKAAQDYLGHASIESTLRYAKHATQKKLEVMDKLTQMRDKSRAKVAQIGDIKIIENS